MMDGSGNACITPVQESLTGGKANIPLVLTRECINPRVSLSLVDAKGGVLAQKELSLISPPSSQSPVSQTIPVATILVVLGAVVVLGGGAYALKRRREAQEPLPLP